MTKDWSWKENGKMGDLVKIDQLELYKFSHPLYKINI